MNTNILVVLKGIKMSKLVNIFISLVFLVTFILVVGITPVLVKKEKEQAIAYCKYLEELEKEPLSQRCYLLLYKK